ncbi:hypothetical protein GCM10010912_52380 [Paenibacillus albidus]|uniref:Glucosyl transferase GtrII n=1 Tax=Paenibacillus albidus TaxID=2041023 RepID=A0A917CY15_9BACL|nr:glucosyltransferase domain-containing protein [Paenibacillus albidus]GGG01082.1 hypothetical protein GCM10010912_52380 [Paenibacillus albidus]
MLAEALQRNKYYWLSISITIALAYGFTLTNPSMGVDDESFDRYINGGALLAQGRWGGHLTQYVFNTFDYIPFWRDFIGVLLIATGITLWGYILQKFSDKYFNDKSIIVFSCVSISCPLIAENFIFMMTTIEMGIVLCLIPIALNYFFEQVVNKKSFVHLLFAVILFTFALSYSELAVVYFVFGIFTVCFLLVYFSSNKNEFTLPKVLFILIKGLVLTAVVLLFNSVITSGLQSLFSVSPSGYTSNYIQYDFSSVGNLFSSLFEFIKVFFGFSFIGKSMGIYVAFASAFLLLIYSVMGAVNNKKITYLLLGLGIILSAFSMYFITGNINLVNRIFITYSVFTGFVIALIYMYFQNKKVLKINLHIIVSILVVLTVLYQTKYINQVFDTDYKRYQLDLAKMNSIAEEIKEYNGDNSQKEIVFVGLPENYNLKLGDTEGYSIFQWDRFNGIQSELRKSGRIFRFMNLHGYNFKELTNMDEQEIIKNASGMQQYPRKGYVKDFGDYLIVKIGPSTYETSDFTAKEFNEMYSKDSSEVKYTKDWFSYENNILSLGGWGGIQGAKSSNTVIQAALINDQRQYYLKTGIERRESTKADDYNGLNTGYHIYSFDTSTLISGTYKVVLIFSDNDAKRLVHIEETIHIP